MMPLDSKVSPTDPELVQDYLQGNTQAFHRLYDRHHRAVYLLVRQYFPRPERADEVFQEIFMKILEKIGHFQSEGSFKAWLFTVSRNHCIDRLRYQARRPEIPESAFEEPEPRGALDPTQENQAYENQLTRHLQRALDKLPEDQRETFILKESAGLTFEEIAQMTGVSINTAKSRMRYALIQLRRALGGKPFIKEARS